MTYDLVIGDRAYSSWSLRGWLLFDAFGLPVKLHTARLYTDELPTLLKQFHPGKTAPTMRTPDGVAESLGKAFCILSLPKRSVSTSMIASRAWKCGSAIISGAR